MKTTLTFVLSLFLVSCASQAPAPVRATPVYPVSKPQNIQSSKPFYPITKQKQCVPHAREVSGIPIRGNAHTWWGQADGRYKKGARPKVGAVMVLSKTKRLKYGHLAVVKNIIDKRNIEVEHTNWGGSLKSRCIVYTQMPVKDVSPNNDWSQARFFNYPSGTYGRVYRNSGFIYAPTKTATNAK